MFTGIIEQTGELSVIEPLAQGLRFCITTHSKLEPLKIGDSVAVNGVCLTVVRLTDQMITFDVSPETLEKTNFALLTQGELLHLELPLTMGTAMGGHFVLGHVDEAVQIKRMEAVESFTLLEIKGVSYPQWICEKGSITLDGVSLTINGISEDNVISCMLIPHTMNNTRFKHLKPSDWLNAEYDYIAKMVARQQLHARST